MADWGKIAERLKKVVEELKASGRFTPKAAGFEAMAKAGFARRVEHVAKAGVEGLEAEAAAARTARARQAGERVRTATAPREPVPPRPSAEGPRKATPAQVTAVAKRKPIPGETAPLEVKGTRQERRELFRLLTETRAEYRKVLLETPPDLVKQAEAAEAAAQTAQEAYEAVLATGKTQSIRLASEKARQARDAVREIMRTSSQAERVVELLRLESELWKKIEATGLLARTDRYLDEWKRMRPWAMLVANPAQVAIAIARALTNPKNAPKLAAMILFSLFIFEEVAQAFGFMLSFNLQNQKDRFSDPDRTSDAEWAAVRARTEAALRKYKIVAESFVWWVKYPGAIALWFAEPYEHYAAASVLSIGWTEALILQIEADRALAKGGEVTPAVRPSAVEAGLTTDQALDAANGYGYQLSDYYKEGVRTGRPELYVPMMRVTLGKMEKALAEARRIIDLRKPQLRPKSLLDTRELAYQMIDANLQHWRDMIKSMDEGPPGADEESGQPLDLEGLHR